MTLLERREWRDKEKMTFIIRGEECERGRE